MLAPPRSVAAPSRPNNCSESVSPAVSGTINVDSRLLAATVGVITEAAIGTPLSVIREDTNNAAVVVTA